MGVVGAGLLQALLPAVLVLPGLAAFALLGSHDISMVTPDRAYFRLLDAVFSAEGIWGPLARGLAVSVVVAAAMSVVGAVLNAASTLWSIDIAQDMLLRTANEAGMIRRGRWSSLVALLIGVAAAPLLLWWKQGILVYIEEVAAVATPPLAVVLLAAFFWPRAHGRAATWTLLLGIAAGGLLWAARWTLMEPPAWLLAPLNARRHQRTGQCNGPGGGNVPHSPSAYDRYDPDTAWNLRWARLPSHQRRLAGGARNAGFWWAVMLAAMIAGWLVFGLR